MRKTYATAIAVLACSLSLAVWPAAAADANKAALKCRKTIGKKAVAAVRGALKRLDGCHKRRDKSGAGECNVIDDGALRRALAATTKACRNVPGVLANYDANDPAGAIAAAVKGALEASANEVQGSPTVAGDKAKGKCHAAIGAGRSAVVNAIVRGATACQRSRDKGANGFGVIAPDCIGGAGDAGGKAQAKIERACSGIAGGDVGSCAALPGCVVESATGTAGTVARSIYASGRPECYNGVVDPGEDCDPGPVPDTDACVQCHFAGCGDGRTVPPEECDDGNRAPGDGCDDQCRVEVPPGGSLVTLTVALTHDPALTSDVAGVELNVDYPPAKVAIPGSGNVPTAGGRVANLGPDAATFSVADRDATLDGQDDQLFIAYGTTDVVPPGDIVRVLMDGLPGATPTGADFACTVTNAVDAFGIPVGGITCGVTISVSTVTTTTTTATTTATTASLPASTSTTTTTAGATTTAPASTTTTGAAATTTTTTGGAAVCGNGTRESAEECDDGNDVNTDGCTNGCLDAVCGDGFTRQGVEQCDDGNAVNDDFCTNACTFAPAVCGDGVRQNGETCDDGNTADGDACPSSCHIGSCTATGTRLDTSVTYTKPAATSVGGLVVYVDYPDGKAGIPGLGNATSVRGRIAGLQTGFTHVANDLDYALRETLAAQTPGATLSNGVLFTVSYDRCTGQPAPVAAEFTCTVVSASTPQGQDMNLGTNPMTCGVTIP